MDALSHPPAHALLVRPNCTAMLQGHTNHHAQTQDIRAAVRTITIMHELPVCMLPPCMPLMRHTEIHLWGDKAVGNRRMLRAMV